MAIDIFEPLKDLQGNKMKSASWYRNAVSLITDRSSASDLFASGRQTGRPSGGRMSMFFYDPKTKSRLPYYDTFPLVLPLESIKGGFMGMNFHYLPPLLRFRLLQRMQRFADGGLNEKTKIDATYDDVKGIGLVKPTIKKYLYGHVRSQFLRIDFDEAALAVYLPVQQFKKAGTSRVYADSRRMI